MKTSVNEAFDQRFPWDYFFSNISQIIYFLNGFHDTGRPRAFLVILDDRSKVNSLTLYTLYQNYDVFASQIEDIP